MISLDQAKTLKSGNILYHMTFKDCHGLPLQVRVNCSTAKLWKRSPERFQVAFKYGLYNYGYLTESNAHDFTLDQDEAKGYPHPLRKRGDWNKFIDLISKLDPKYPEKRPTKAICSKCNKIIEIKHDSFTFTTGYGIDNSNDNIVCYDCCAEEDKRLMIETGKLTLYLTKQNENAYKISNWPGSLVFTTSLFTESDGGNSVFDSIIHVWFTGPDGSAWIGRHQSKNGSHQLVSCRRLNVKC